MSKTAYRLQEASCQYPQPSMFIFLFSISSSLLLSPLPIHSQRAGSCTVSFRKSTTIIIPPQSLRLSSKSSPLPYSVETIHLTRNLLCLNHRCDQNCPQINLYERGDHSNPSVGSQPSLHLRNNSTVAPSNRGGVRINISDRHLRDNWVKCKGCRVLEKVGGISTP